MGLATWAHSAIDRGTLEDRYSLADALTTARELDRPDIFDIDYGEDDQREHEARMTAGAVAGTAFVVARFTADAEWTDEFAAWCLDIFERAATSKESSGLLGGRQAGLSMSPGIFAVYGYSSLLARNVQADLCQRALINLAVDVLEQVAGALCTASYYYAKDRPEFLWILVDLAVRTCFFERGAGPDSHSPVWGEAEATRLAALIQDAEESLEQETPAGLPSVPALGCRSYDCRRRPRTIGATTSNS